MKCNFVYGMQAATEKQKQCMDDLFIDYDQDITKREASKLISEELEVLKKRNKNRPNSIIMIGDDWYDNNENDWDSWE